MTAESFWSRVLDLFERSVIVQSILTLGVIGSVIYLAVAGREVSSILQDMAYLIGGFWFGSKVENAQSRAVIQRMMNNVSK